MESFVSYPGAVTATAGSPGYAQRDSSGEIDSLRSEMSRYAATIDELYSRLDTVLKPEYAEPNATLDHPMPVMSEIATLRSQFAVNTSRLQALISRVDL